MIKAVLGIGKCGTICRIGSQLFPQLFITSRETLQRQLKQFILSYAIIYYSIYQDGRDNNCFVFHSC